MGTSRYSGVGLRRLSVTLTLVAAARETETVPASGKRIALMLVPAAVVMMLGAPATGVRPVTLALGTFAMTWGILGRD